MGKRAREKKDDIRRNKTLVRRWLRGQKVMNRITESERRLWLQRLTIEEARQIFDDLNQLGDRWKEFGRDLEALEALRVESKIEDRRIFMEIASKQVIEGADG